jgi:hypothetical protein
MKPSVNLNANKTAAYFMVTKLVNGRDCKLFGKKSLFEVTDEVVLL